MYVYVICRIIFNEKSSMKYYCAYKFHRARTVLLHKELFRFLIKPLITFKFSVDFKR